jgi:hypothetical protein
MWIEHMDDGQEMVRTRREIDGKSVNVLVPMEEYQREKEAARNSAAERAMEEERARAEQDRLERQAKLAEVSPLTATIELARRGRKEILPQLRQTLDEHPELWQHFGNLALQTQESWLQLIAGKDLYLAESLRRHLDAMRSELAGPDTSPLERLLVDRILACHVAVLYFEAVETTNPGGENSRVAKYRMQRQDQANRQFLASVKTLATVR